MATLATYEQQVADLLHDPNNTTWTVSQLDAYINEARRKLVMDTGCLRSLQASQITAGVEQYTYGQVTGAAIITGGSGYTNPTIAFTGGGGSGVAATLTASNGAVNTITFTSFGSGYTSAPSYTVVDPTGTGATLSIGALNVNTYDMLGVAVLWGTQRYSLQYRAFSIFSAMLRQWTSTTYQRQPVAWTTYGDSSIFIGPPPDQTYAVEFDTIILPAVMADYLTNDSIPVVAQDPIKFYAAYLAKFNNQSYGEGEMLLEQYTKRMLEVSAAYTRRLPDVYSLMR